MSKSNAARKSNTNGNSNSKASTKAFIEAIQINAGTKPTTGAVAAKVQTNKAGKREVIELQLSKEQKKAFDEQITLSAKIRYLNSQQFSTGQISKFLTKEEGRNIRYQHVRNVLITPMKRGLATKGSKAE